MRLSTPLIAAILVASPALATPPQVISVDETLIAIGGPGQFLFVLRELKDNMGSHSRLQTDVVLIARSKATNQDVYLWPISRTVDNGPNHVETKDSPRVVTLPLKVAYNPWQVSATHHGHLANQTRSDADSALKMLTSSDGALITLKTPSFAYEPPKGTPKRTSYWAGYATLTKVVEQSLMNTRYAFRPYYTEGTDPLISSGFNFEHDCEFDYFAELSEQTDGEQQGFWASKILCENEYSMAPVSMFITLQPLP